MRKQEQLAQQQQRLMQLHQKTLQFKMHQYGNLSKMYASNGVASNAVAQDPLLTPMESTDSPTQKPCNGMSRKQMSGQLPKPERNLWRTGEIMEMLNIIQCSNALQMLNCKAIKNDKVFKQIEQIMHCNGYKKKSYFQMWTKWKFLKSSYMTSKRNDVMPRMIAPKIYEMLNNILTADNAAKETTCERLIMDANYTKFAESAHADMEEDGEGDAYAEQNELNDDSITWPKITSVEGGYKNKVDEAQTAQPTVEQLDMAHPIFGFRLTDVKDEPLDTGYEATLNLTDSYATAANDTSHEDSSNVVANAKTRSSPRIRKSCETEEAGEFITNHLPIGQSVMKNVTTTAKKATAQHIPPLRIAQFAKEANMSKVHRDRPPPPLALVNQPIMYSERGQAGNMKLIPPETEARIAKAMKRTSAVAAAAIDDVTHQQILQMQQAAYALAPERPMPQLSTLTTPKTIISQVTTTTTEVAAAAGEAASAKTGKPRKPRGPYNVYKKVKLMSPANAAIGLQRKRRLDIPWPETNTQEPPPKQPKHSSTLNGTTATTQQQQQQSADNNSNNSTAGNATDKKFQRKQQKLMEKTLKELTTSMYQMQRETLKDFFEKQLLLAQQEHEFQMQQDMLLMRAFQEQSQVLLKSAKRLIQLENDVQQREQEEQQQQQQQQQHKQANDTQMWYQQQAEAAIKTNLSLAKKRKGSKNSKPSKNNEQQQNNDSANGQQAKVSNGAGRAAAESSAGSDSSSGESDSGSDSDSEDELTNNPIYYQTVQMAQQSNAEGQQHMDDDSNTTTSSIAADTEHTSQQQASMQCVDNEIVDEDDDDDDEDESEDETSAANVNGQVK